MKHIAHPLSVGEVLAETTRLYGERIGSAAGIGVFVMGAYVLATQIAPLPGVVVLLLAQTAAFAAAVRVVDGDPAWSEWHQTAVEGDISGSKKNGSIYFYPAKGDAAKMTLTFTNAIPKEHSFSGLDANSNSHTTESITFSVETLELQ